MRQFPFITIGVVLERLSEAGIPIKRATYYRLEKRLDLPRPKKTTGQLQWRVYNEEQVDQIVEAVKREYNIQ